MNLEWEKELTMEKTAIEESIIGLRVDIAVIRSDLKSAARERSENREASQLERDEIREMVAELRKAVEAISVSQALVKHSECPKPGMCLDLSGRLDVLEIEMKTMRDDRMTARGALVVIGSLVTFVLGLGAWFVKAEWERHGKGP